MLYVVSGLLVAGISVYLIWALRELILPIIIGMVMAYICLPLIDYLKGKRFSRFWAIIFLFGTFCLSLFYIINLIGQVVPDQREELELKVRVRYKIDQKFNQIMGLGSFAIIDGGNFFYSLLGKEIEPLKDSVDQVLRLSDSERKMLEKLHAASSATVKAAGGEKYWDYYQVNRRRDAERKRQQEIVKNDLRQEPDATPESTGGGESLLLVMFNAISLWLITPLVFLILLFDDGKLKKGLVQMVPNRYFEVTLMVLENINAALGKYLRGTAIECFLMATSFSFCLFVVGLDMRWAVSIGIIAGLANAIPFLGPVIGLVVGVLYAIMAEEVNSVFHFINPDNLIFAILVVVGVVQLIDNAVFQPYVLGGSVDLHPLVVTVGVMGGAVIFGFAGMLFAIPAIVVMKVVVFTLFDQLRAYYII